MTSSDPRLRGARCPELILASGSPRRFELLAAIGVEFRALSAAIDETPRATESPLALASRLAVDKAVAVARLNPGSVVLGSDTVVAVDGQSLGKPADADQAREMLRCLSGRRHIVHSAVARVGPGASSAQACSSTTVDFAPLPADWIDWYVDSGEPMDKAGAYAIQGAAALWIPRIEGSYSGVVGLPLFETAALLRAAGFDIEGISGRDLPMETMQREQ